MVRKLNSRSVQCRTWVTVWVSAVVFFGVPAAVRGDDLAAAGFDVELRISLLGVSRLFISKADGSAFTLDLEIDAIPDHQVTITGDPETGLLAGEQFTITVPEFSDVFTITLDADDVVGDNDVLQVVSLLVQARAGAAGLYALTAEDLAR